MFISGAALTELLTNKTEEWTSKFPDRSGIVSPVTLTDKIIYLHYCNFYQWHKEDTAHDMQLNESEIGRLKRKIDTSNLDRSAMIDRIDAYFVSKLRIIPTENWSKFYINSHTLGEIIDKLSILCLKRFFAQLRLKKSAPESAEKYIREIETVEELVNYVTTCYDRFLKHLSVGKGYMPYGQFKTYGA
ncbi:MAG: DUF4254 domain-containing protein [Dehalococcoidales bacterium]